jgi:hypothetical protein
MLNKSGKVSAGAVILIVAVLLVAYSANFLGLKDMFKGTPGDGGDTGVKDECPSSGLTEWTINAQEALASTATNANVTYYIFDSTGGLVTSGDTGSDGTTSVDLACGTGKTYKALIINEKTASGYYPEEITIVADKPTTTTNLKVYEYGQVNVAGISSSADPTGDDNISAGTGKLCGFTITFSENESASAFNKPLIMCLVNTTAVTDLTMVGANEVSSKKPLRISSPGGHQYYTFEYPELVKSTSGAIKVNGNIQFTSSATVDANSAKNNMSCFIADQATFKKADWKTLSLSEGFLEAGENQETLVDIGAPDSNRKTLEFGGTYC